MFGPVTSARVPARPGRTPTASLEADSPEAGTEQLALLTLEVIKTRTFATLQQLSLNGSRQGPLILAVEDLHWIDAISKTLMPELSDGFIALPGGLGTLEEIVETLTWVQPDLHQKPCGLLNIGDYFRSLIAFLDHAVSERFIKDVHRAMLLVEVEPERPLEHFERFGAPAVAK